MSSRSDPVRIIEVSPRDGLQNEAVLVPLETKQRLVNDLWKAGAREIEVGSFVSPKWVPQMADTVDVIAGLNVDQLSKAIALVPNLRGLDSALEAGIKRIAIFPAATESFSQRNLNASMSESLDRFAEVARKALDNGVAVRGYVSVAFHCPFEGWVGPSATLGLTGRLFDIGCYEVSICDTTGRATAGHLAQVFEPALRLYGPDHIVAHFHDTFNQGVANAFCAWHMGIRNFDASVAGLGGCPYSPGATGNISTESLVYMFNGLGVETGFDLSKLVAAGREISSAISRKVPNGFLSASMT